MKNSTNTPSEELVLATELWQEGSYSIARRLLQELTWCTPFNVLAWQVWAYLETEQGNYQKARQLFRQGTISNPREAKLWAAWANFEQVHGTLEEVQRVLQEGRACIDSQEVA